MEKAITYFEKPGIENTDALIGLVKERLEGSDIKYVAIASSTGASALKLNEALKDMDVTIVNCSHHVGFKEANKAQMDDETRAKLEDEGVVTFMGSHALSGVGIWRSNSSRDHCSNLQDILSRNESVCRNLHHAC